MIRRALLTFVVIAVLFQAMISSGLITGRLVQNQWQENVIRAENFLIRSRKAKRILLGSSRSMRMDSAAIDATSLALAGSGPLIGLDIVQRSNARPEKLLLEINNIDMPGSAGFLDDLLNPVGMRLRSAIPAFRHENQPMNFIAQIPYTMVAYVISRRNQATPQSNSQVDHQPAASPSSASTQSWGTPPLESVLLEYSRDPDTHRMKKACEDLQATRLKLGQSVRVIVFRMPMHPLIEKSNGYVKKKLIMDECLQRGDFSLIPYPAVNDYSFTDGIHMDSVSAVRYAKYLKEHEPD